MSDEIKPALGGFGWREDMPFVVVKDRINTPRGTSIFVRLDIDGRFVISNDDHEGRYEVDDLEPEKQLAVAALALYGRPFGFTWDDVDVLRGAAIVESDEDMGFNEHVLGLAARVAALLPPREP